MGSRLIFHGTQSGIRVKLGVRGEARGRAGEKFKSGQISLRGRSVVDARN